MSIAKRALAEFIGTFWLVLGGCGSAVLAAQFIGGVDLGNQVKFPLGIGLVGVSLAFGLTLLTMAYAIGHISGCHINPAVSIGLWAGKRFPSSDLIPYIIAQVFGGILAGFIIYTIASGAPGFALTAPTPLATNGYGAHSPGGYSFFACLVTEVVMTFMFLLVILGATDRRAPQGLAGIPIGLALTLIHLISIPVTNTSVNPARSTGVAVFAKSGEIAGQLWFFWVFPIIGALLAGWLYASFFAESRIERVVTEEYQNVP